MARDNYVKMELRSAEVRSVEYLFQRNAWLEMPLELETSAPASVNIYYNYYGPEVYEFRCTYSSTSNRTTSDFVNCTTSEGQIIMDQPSDLELLQFPMDKTSKIMMELTGSESDRPIIRSSFKVDWK